MLFHASMKIMTLGPWHHTIRDRKVPDAACIARKQQSVVQDNRESGESPERSRRCVSGAFSQAEAATVLAWEGEKMC